LGGTVSFYSFWEPLAEKLAPQGERFKCCLPFYPATYIKPEENRWNSGPILNLVGESDNYTPAALVHQMSDIVNASGGNSSVISYPGGEHSFDSINPVTHWPDAIAVSEKFCTVAKDGNMTYETDSGEKLGMNQPEDRLKIFESGEIHFGASTGGDWSIRRQCQKDALDFFKKNL
jgi:dienelactone hydrolase